MGREKDAFGDRMKSYEQPYMQRTVPGVPMVIRVNGCHFHSFTRGMARPFDPVLRKTMSDTMLDLCKDVSGAVFGYTQSDEISILCRVAGFDSREHFEGRVQKIVSVTASKATLHFNRNFAENVRSARSGTDPELMEVYRSRLYGAEFDSRVMSIPESDVYNYFVWRQTDAAANSLSMVCQSVFPQSDLTGKGRSELMDMLMSAGVNWNDVSTSNKRGTCCYRKDADGRSRWFLDDEMMILTSDEGRDAYSGLLS